MTGMLGSCRRDAGPVRVDRIGMIEYVAAWEAQRAHAEARRAGTGPDVLMLLEHHSVYTAGKRTQPEDRPTDGTPVIDVDRGGRITWHGPGQLVGYPIVALAEPMDVVDFVRRLKAQPGKDILIMGGGELARPLLEHYARTEPVKLMAAAAATGSLLVLVRPWRLLSATAVIAAVLKTSDVADLVNTLLQKPARPPRQDPP